MHDASLAPSALEARCGSRVALGAALRASRADTLATFACYEQALPRLQVPMRAELNPPLWELGHVGWFQDYWIARNPQRSRGAAADPDIARLEPSRPGADALYDSSRVAHGHRWALALPCAQDTRGDLERQLEATLSLLQASGDSDDDLYFFRLALLHEDMHHEAALYMARSLGIAIDDPRWQPQVLPDPPARLRLGPRRWRLGVGNADGFVFDNEREGLEVDVHAFEIDAQVVRWSEYLPFVEAGGYAQPRWWSDEGDRWRLAQGAARPFRVRRTSSGWEQAIADEWRALDLRAAACHLTRHEAEAWCRWAGRRLPSEAEWERAALEDGERFRWGDVWEWTSSPFAPFPGFQPHPYRDYSAPWFDGRPVLKGACCFTQPRMRHPKYRNFFPATRNDVLAGFRSCAP
jgi:ergothioneine biosynthesis protein EgtB